MVYMNLLLFYLYWVLCKITVLILVFDLKLKKNYYLNLSIWKYSSIVRWFDKRDDGEHDLNIHSMGSVYLFILLSSGKKLLIVYNNAVEKTISRKIKKKPETYALYALSRNFNSYQWPEIRHVVK